MRVIRAAILCLPLVLATVMSACGGGTSGGGAGPSNPGTPAGTYSITVSATFTSGPTTLKHNLTLTLKVEETGHFQRFIPRSAGSLKLDAGPATLSPNSG